METSLTETLWPILFIGTAITFGLSFVYMVKKRGTLSALFWTLIPFRFLLSWGSETDFDDNPEWLDYLQTSFLVAMGLLWFWGKAHS